MSDYRKLFCPVCKTGHILDEAKRPGSVRAILYHPDDAANAVWFIKCQRCKNQIGMSPQKIE